MGFFEKLMFWKKEPEFSSSAELPPFPGEGGFDSTLSRAEPFGPTPGFDQFGSGRSSSVEPSGYPAPSSSAPNFGSASSFSSSTMPTSSHENTIISKNIELVSAKIDALQAAIDSMNQRLVNIENIARGEQEEKKYRRW